MAGPHREPSEAQLLDVRVGVVANAAARGGLREAGSPAQCVLRTGLAPAPGEAEQPLLDVLAEMWRYVVDEQGIDQCR
ncbi:hypothetical protein ABZX93_12670 [Streptomyces sp. NPDC006632]|uniref:hypothetical protein n=1 Tax=Streptomyces sp. NPDC006632 TaxID=3157182 RepID=UPI0033BAAF34